MAKYAKYLGTKSNNGNLRIMPSVSVEGATAMSNMTRVGVGNGRFVCTIGTGDHPLIAEIKASLNRPAKVKATKKVVNNDPEA
jgi:hypothetical protein